jgi:hypothetical protein
MCQNNRNRPIPLLKKLLQIIPRPFLIKRHHNMHSLSTNPLHNPLPAQIQLPMRPQPGIRLPDLLTLKQQRMRRLFGVRCESDEGYPFVYFDDGCVEGGWFADVEVEDSGTGLGTYAEEVAESLTDR